MTRMEARIPKIKPGKATVDYLTKIQASTRFWGTNKFQLLLLVQIIICIIFPLTITLCIFVGGLLLSLLATSSTILDHYLRGINEGFAIGFTSVLIIVSSYLISLNKITCTFFFIKVFILFPSDHLLGGFNNRIEKILSSIQCHAGLEQGFEEIWSMNWNSENIIAICLEFHLRNLGSFH
jgi:hypothetical protein